MIIRPFFAPDDYEIIKKWFEKRGWGTKTGAAPSLNILPTSGFVCIDEETFKMQAAAWIYLSYNSSLAFLEWSVTNPDLAPRTALKSLKFLIEGIKEKVSLLDPPVTDIIQFIPSERLCGFYEKHLGFKTSERATLMVWSRS